MASREVGAQPRAKSARFSNEEETFGAYPNGEDAPDSIAIRRRSPRALVRMTRRRGGVETRIRRACVGLQHQRPQSHTVTISDVREAPGWMRHIWCSTMERAMRTLLVMIVVARLTPVGIGGGRKCRDTDFTTEDLWGSRNPISGLRSGVDVVVVGDAERRIKGGVQS